MTYKETVKTVAAKFCEKLQRDLDLDEIALVVTRNRQEKNAIVCHTNDFCDANMSMAEAFEEVVGKEPDPSDEQDAATWSDAWDLAKKEEFNMGEMRNHPCIESCCACEE